MENDETKIEYENGKDNVRIDDDGVEIVTLPYIPQQSWGKAVLYNIPDGGILTGDAIKKYVENGMISIDPYDEKQINPNSYNLRLSNKLLTYKDLKGVYGEPNPLDPYLRNRTYEYTIPEYGFTLHPGILYIGSTIESTSTDNFVPMIEGRSSIGRLGISVHVTAGFGDIGFSGTWTLEITCVEPVIIYPGMEICQISFHTAVGDRSILYDGRYANQKEPTESRLYLDKETEEK